MTFDIICFLLVILAFVGGFQKGVVRIFSFLMAIGLAAIVTIWSVPYLTDFLVASLPDVPGYLPSIILCILFVSLCWILSSLVQTLWKPTPKKKPSPVQNVAGGVILSSIMVISIAILSGFFEQTQVITATTKETSIAYKILIPINESSRQLWINLTQNHQTIKDQSNGNRNEI
ncbi:MAG: CvpA family protein [Saprospiraceae bacterium]|nr:CvpA family protein [Saprospiraceae bacterium]